MPRKSAKTVTPTKTLPTRTSRSAAKPAAVQKSPLAGKVTKGPGRPKKVAEKPAPKARGGRQKKVVEIVEEANERARKSRRQIEVETLIQPTDTPRVRKAPKYKFQLQEPILLKAEKEHDHRLKSHKDKEEEPEPAPKPSPKTAGKKKGAAAKAQASPKGAKNSPKTSPKGRTVAKKLNDSPKVAKSPATNHASPKSPRGRPAAEKKAASPKASPKGAPPKQTTRVSPGRQTKKVATPTKSLPKRSARSTQ